jgi:hypothetical protein
MSDCWINQSRHCTVYSTVHCLITSGNRDQCASELGGNRGLSPLRTACRKIENFERGSAVKKRIRKFVHLF